MKVKVCGITTLEDAEAAVALGADALGFNFCRTSPRFLDPAAARKIVRRLPPFVARVGVFADEADPSEVERRASESGVTVIQLHGCESAEYCRRLRGRILIKALSIGPGFDPRAAGEFPVQALLLDSHPEGGSGGTGRTFDWELAAGLGSIAVPVIVAGGLSAANVAAAIRRFRPYAVDVCSGVEREPGRKDADKLRAFMAEVRNAADEGI